ncbi:glycosyltransferase 87 family protein [Spongiactinospora sp. 9N601]|uniref:glycosyltransferase 87 family protein n=1 Tax=Spongiactinospora sp. 9N601 TaxID=3375149 RepID=UPI0037A9F137
MITPQRSSARAALTIIYLWLATRVLLLLMVLDVVTIFESVNVDVGGVYQNWYGVMRTTGSLPVDDPTWQYPPGAALLMIAPSLLPFGYLSGFMAILVVCDALVTYTLARLPERAGLWVWLAGVPLLGPVVYARYDLVVAALAVLGLVRLRRSSTGGGLLLGVATGLKLWPALALIGVPRGRVARNAVLGAAAGAAVTTLGVLAFLGRGADFLSAQRDRGVEVESVWALAFHFARWAGWPGEVAPNYGSMEMIGPFTAEAGRLSLVVTAGCLLWLVYWRRRARTWTDATPADAALAAVLLFVVTSRVISPQYLVWLVGLAAVCAAARGTSQRPVVTLVLAATAVTMLEFPNLFVAVQESTVVGVAVLTLRNGLLVAAAVVSCVRLWRATTVSSRAPLAADQS